MARSSKAAPRGGALNGARAIVVGAGVAGLCTALELRRAGAACLLIDPGPGSNASAVAAGMLAPAFESVLDDASHGRFALLRAGRDLWAESGVPVRRDGALWIPADEADLPRMAARLEAEGAAAETLSPEHARRMAPGVRAPGAVFTPDDWTLDPPAALQALRRRYAALGGRLLQAEVRTVGADGVGAADARRLEADAVVVCAGYKAAGLQRGAPELGRLSPIRGELVRFPGAGPAHGPTLRHRGGYIVPAAAGPVAGATMEPGSSDLGPPRASDGLAAAAASVLPPLAAAPYEGSVGVRAATPDGLPLVGRSVSGVWLATGFRRNGWALALLSARIVAAGVAGADPGPWAETLRPDRASLA